MTQSIMVWLLFESEGAVLLTKRRRAPFAGQWTLPGAAMTDEESAEETVARYAREQLGVEATGEEFEETLYINEGVDNYVTNVFRVTSFEGGLRYREGGDVEEARWVRRKEATDLSAFPMPQALRALLFAGGDRGPVGTPDNKASWDAISAMYQAQHRLKTDAAHYGPRMPTENDLRLLGDVRGKRILEVGCGGGQCSIAFAKQGAAATGIDQSSAQIAYARALAEREGVRVDFIEGDVTTLPWIASGSQDAVFSAHALNYVEDIESCFDEVRRVLKPGGPFVFSAGHPVRAMVDDADVTIVRPYWDEYQEWEWGEGSGVWMRSWDRTTERWVELLRGAGFAMDRLLEPRMRPEAHDESWDDSYPLSQGLVIPVTLIIKAVKE